MARITGAFIIAFFRDRVLMVRDTHTREWMLPGGKRDSGETPWIAAVREFNEETGNPLPEFSRLLGIDDNRLPGFSRIRGVGQPTHPGLNPKGLDYIRVAETIQYIGELLNRVDWRGPVKDNETDGSKYFTLAEIFEYDRRKEIRKFCMDSFYMLINDKSYLPFTESRPELVEAVDVVPNVTSGVVFPCDLVHGKDSLKSSRVAAPVSFASSPDASPVSFAARRTARVSSASSPVTASDIGLRLRHTPDTHIEHSLEPRRTHEVPDGLSLGLRRTHEVRDGLSLGLRHLDRHMDRPMGFSMGVPAVRPMGFSMGVPAVHPMGVPMVRPMVRPMSAPMGVPMGVFMDVPMGVHTDRPKIISRRRPKTLIFEPASRFRMKYLKYKTKYLNLLNKSKN